MQFVWHITGTTALILHNGRLANPLDEAARELKKRSGKQRKTDADYMEVARVEHAGSLYLDEQGPYIPGQNLERCLVDAARMSRRGPKVIRGVFVTTDRAPLVYDGPRTVDGLWKDENHRHVCTVVIARQRVPRCRPIFQDWKVTATGFLDDGQLNFTELQDIAETAGQLVGLGDWRPRYGRFMSQMVKAGPQ